MAQTETWQESDRVTGQLAAASPLTAATRLFILWSLAKSLERHKHVVQFLFKALDYWAGLREVM